jgi:putative transcriptional regulator
MTTSDFETVDALLAHYAAGTLPEPARVLVEAHLELKPRYREAISAFEAVAGQMVETTDPSPLSAPEAMLSNILHSAPPASQPFVHAANTSDILQRERWPRALREFAGIDADDIPWRWKLPGLKQYSLGKIDGCDVRFYRIRPGRAIPEHTHDGFELSLVLHGAFSDVRGRFARGDISVADESLDHRPIAEAGEHCIVFAVTDAPVRLRGSIGRRLGDLLG